MLGTIIDTFGGLASTILSLSACLMLFVNPLRKKFIQWARKLAQTEAKKESDELLLELNKQIQIVTEDIEKQILIDQAQTDALLSLLRSSITHMYYKHEEDKTLRDYEAKAVTSQIEIYTALGGNSFIHQLAKIMENWNIIE